MIFSYYTPKALAYYFINNKYNIEKQFKAINRLYEFDFTFIHPKYKNDRKLFKQDIQDSIDYILDTEDYLNAERAIEKDFEQLGIKYENNLSEEEVIDYYLITVRLDRILENKLYSRKKLRTLLKTYGYKRKSNKIVNHIQDSLKFYHIIGYVNKEPVNFSEISLDQMITFVVQDYDDINFDKKNITSKVQLIYELLENEVVNYNSKIKIQHEQEFVKYLLDNTLLFEIFFKEEYLKIRLNIQEEFLPNNENLKLNYYHENNKIYLYLHDRKDISELMEIIKYIRNYTDNNISTDSFKNNKNGPDEKIVYVPDDIEDDKFISEFYHKLKTLLR